MSARDGGPAFPDGLMPDAGMSLRDWFAGQALAGLISGVSEESAAAAAKALEKSNAFEIFAFSAYGYADAMLAARNAPESAQEPAQGANGSESHPRSAKPERGSRGRTDAESRR